MLRDLYPHQVRALDGLKLSILAGKRRPLLQAPTGSGKTVISAHIVTGAKAKGKRVVFCVPSLGLIDQTMARFAENGIDKLDMGIIQANHSWRRPDAPIQIATAQTLTRRELPPADVVVIDEAHVRFKVYDGWMKDRPETLFIGLSATPWAKGLGKHYDDLIKPTSTAELIDLGFLSRFKVYAPSHPDLEGVRTVAGDYHEGDLSQRMDKPELVADIVSTWLDRAKGLPTLVFATGRMHAQNLAARFAAHGVSTAYIDAETPREEREEIGAKLATGEVQVVCNIGCLTTGIDWDVRALVLARPTKSESLFVQIIGRALRTAPGKSHAMILDHSDTHLRLGMVTDIDHDELDDGTVKPKAKPENRKDRLLPLPKQCHACDCLVPATMSECPACGATPPKPVFREGDGELVELGARGPRPPVPTATEMLRNLGKQRVYSGLLWIRADKNRAKGWAAHTYKEIFGVWPRGLAEEADYPDPRLISYCRHKAIRWAKARDARAAA